MSDIYARSGRWWKWLVPARVFNAKFASASDYTLPWGTSLTATYRLDVGNEIWYQTTFQGNQGWIGARVGSANVSNINCVLPLPYPSTWPDLAQITAADFATYGNYSASSIKSYLKNEPTELLLARIAYAEAAVFRTGGTGEDFMGGVVFEDARLITWIVRLGALMGLPNYGSSFTAGLSTSIQDVILDPDEYQPITDLIASLTGSGANCDPTQFGTSVADNVKRMVFPVNSELRQVVELFIRPPVFE